MATLAIGVSERVIVFISRMIRRDKFENDTHGNPQEAKTLAE